MSIIRQNITPSMIACACDAPRSQIYSNQSELITNPDEKTNQIFTFTLYFSKANSSAVPIILSSSRTSVKVLLNLVTMEEHR